MMYVRFPFGMCSGGRIKRERLDHATGVAQGFDRRRIDGGYARSWCTIWGGQPAPSTPPLEPNRHDHPRAMGRVCLDNNTPPARRLSGQNGAFRCKISMLANHGLAIDKQMQSLIIKFDALQDGADIAPVHWCGAGGAGKTL